MITLKITLTRKSYNDWSTNTDFLSILNNENNVIIKQFTFDDNNHQSIQYFNINEGDYCVKLSDSLRFKDVKWSISVINSGILEFITDSEIDKMIGTLSLRHEYFKSLTSVNSEYGIIENLIVKNIIFSDYKDFPLQIKTLDGNLNQSRLLMGDNIPLSRVFRNKFFELPIDNRNLKKMNLSYPVKKK